MQIQGMCSVYQQGITFAIGISKVAFLLCAVELFCVTIWAISGVHMQ